LKLPFFFAKRYLISKKSHNAINIITGISILGVAIGTMALVVVLSAFNGLSDLVQSLYFSFSPDVEIAPASGKTFAPTKSYMLQLKSINGIVQISEVVEGNALLKFDDKQSIVTIKGVSDNYRQTNRFDTLVKEGVFELDRNKIVLGRGIADVLDVHIGNIYKPISAYAPKRGSNSYLNPEDGLNELKLTPAGLFSINDEFDYKYAFTSIESARYLLDYSNQVTSLEIKLQSKNASKAIEEIKKISGNGLVVKNREQQNELLFKTLKSERLWTFTILTFILIIATFNIIGSLTMLIIEKKKDIVVLSSMGATHGLIQKIFLWEGLLISFIGAVLGMIFGFVLCWIQIHFSIITFNEGFVVDAYPIKYNWMDFVEIFCIVMFIGFLAARYPIRFFEKRFLNT
jgi:lipoprotein-releasing system permease protein